MNDAHLDSAVQAMVKLNLPPMTQWVELDGIKSEAGYYHDELGTNVFYDLKPLVRNVSERVPHDGRYPINEVSAAQVVVARVLAEIGYEKIDTFDPTKLLYMSPEFKR